MRAFRDTAAVEVARGKEGKKSASRQEGNASAFCAWPTMVDCRDEVYMVRPGGSAQQESPSVAWAGLTLASAFARVYSAPCDRRIGRIISLKRN